MRLLCIICLFVGYTYADKTEEEKCCLSKGVSEECAKGLCRLDVPPGVMEGYTLFEERNSNCTPSIYDIAQCLTRKRDSFACCENTSGFKFAEKCFPICYGSAANSGRHNLFARYQSCINLNLGTMFKCMKRSHTESPTAPRELKIVLKQGSSIDLAWKKPEENEDKVHIYKVHLMETGTENHTTVIHDTKETNIKITDLQPNGRFSAFVVAHGTDLDMKSLPSDIVRFSTFNSSSSTGQMFTSTMKLPRHTSKTALVCHLPMNESGKQSMHWQKEVDGQFRKVEGERFKIHTYASEDERFLVSALDIEPMEFDDFGIYKCHIKGQHHQFGLIHLQEYSYLYDRPAYTPPETIFECCTRSIQRPNCQSICGATDADARNSLKAANISIDATCYPEFQNLLKCATKRFTSGACCIKKKIPYNCLGFCDSEFDMTTKQGSECLNHMEKIQACQSETLEAIPGSLTHIGIQIEDRNFFLTFSRPAGAIRFHVYYKMRWEKEWNLKVMETVYTMVGPSEQLAIVSVGENGLSTAYRKESRNGKWVDYFH